MPATEDSSSSQITLDHSDSMFLHPSDHPGMSLVSVPFSGSGFACWKRSMLIALSAKNKVAFVNGSCEKPADNSPKLRQWERCNDMVISWILNALVKDIAQSVLYNDSAKEIWSKLEQRFG